MISIQTNTDSLIAQQNLNVNSQFQSNTIQQLTSGYRINSSSDDAAGLAVANQYRDQIAELNQGVLNANDGTSQLQIIDGGLNNISTMLDRLQTLATESASQTFTGDRGTLNNEYQGLLSEIDRQANNIGLGSTNSVNETNLGVYIGGGQNANTNSSITVDLTNRGVSTAALGLSQTNVLANAAVTVGGANAVAATKIANGNSATFTFVTGANTAASATTAFTITGQAGDTLQSQLSELNTNLQSNNLGITASLNTAGQLQFQSAGAFSMSAVTSDGAGGTPANLVSGTAANATVNNTGLDNYSLNTVQVNAANGTDVQIVVGGTTVDANIGVLGAAATQAQADAINTALKANGVDTVTAVLDKSNAGGGLTLSLQGSTNFTVADDFSGAAGTYGVALASTPGTTAANAQVAIDSITAALANLGQTQGKVGAGENTLNYAINLAQSQITNFSAAQSQIRDANIAADAANLTKAQVLQQSSIAAMAQANAEPQAVLKLLQG